MNNYPLPPAISRILQDPATKHENVGLFFDRYLEWDRQWEFSGEGKKQAFQEVVRVSKALLPQKKLFEAVTARQKAALNVSQSQGITTWSDSIKTDWRMTIGLGTPSVLETGLTMHRLYGFPYLPGSALKGLTRAWAFWQIVEKNGLDLSHPENLQKDDKTPSQYLDVLLSMPMGDPAQEPKQRAAWEKKRNSLEFIPGESWEQFDADAELFQQVFGTQDEAGGVVFFDALPMQPPQLKLDIMNPHYGKYYQREVEYPVEWLTPVPVYFLTVEKTSFLFSLSARRKADNHLVEIAKGWLMNALENMGAGGKTTAGYGYFTSSKPSTDAPTKPQEGPVTTKAESTSPLPGPSPAVVSGPPKGVEWKKGKISKDGRRVAPVDQPDQAKPFRRENVLPKGWTPPGREPVDYAIDKLPDGTERVWVKKLYHKVD